MTALVMGTTVNAQTYDIGVTFDNVSANSDGDVDFSFTITNNGIEIPAPVGGANPDTLYFSLVFDLNTPYSIDNTGSLTISQYTLSPLSTGFPAGASTPVLVSSIEMQEMYENYLGNNLTGNICASVSIGYTLFSGYTSDLTPANNVVCSAYTVTAVLGINETVITEISAFPNPVVNSLTINLGNNSAEVINIIDMTGRTIETITVSNGTENVDMSTYNNGVYFYQVVSQGIAIKTEKIIVAK